MSASKKQIQANRANAQQSTGPKTEEGKAVVSQNSTKHGLYSKDIVIKAAKLKTGSPTALRWVSSPSQFNIIIPILDKY